MSITANDEKSAELAEVKEKKRFKSARRGTVKEVKSSDMSPKVIESWINDTLLEAQNLNIPGVIVKPEQKNPLRRYGIDRKTLMDAGVPEDQVERIYRGMFVYSVGYYELLKKVLSHTSNKYNIITALWKVFSVLLEYCCRADYKMLIA